MTSDQFNEKCVRDLTDANFTQRVAVIGSGPSTPYVPSMAALKEALKTACGITSTADEYPWDFCEKACQANREAYYSAISTSFDANAPLWDARAYKHLVQIPFKSYVTPNYDSQLPRAFREQYSENFAELFTVYPTRTGDQISAHPADLEHKRRLVAVHGYADPDNPQWPYQIILKTSDYNDHYADAKTSRYLFNWWKSLLTHLPCVFIGISLQEPGLYRVVEDLKRDGNPSFNNLKHIHLISAERSEKEAHYPPTSPTFGIFQKIVYDQLDKRHTGLLQVLSAFSHIPTRDPSPGVTRVQPIKLGDVFPF